MVKLETRCNQSHKPQECNVIFGAGRAAALCAGAQYAEAQFRIIGKENSGMHAYADPCSHQGDRASPGS